MKQTFFTKLCDLFNDIVFGQGKDAIGYAVSLITFSMAIYSQASIIVTVGIAIIGLILMGKIFECGSQDKVISKLNQKVAELEDTEVFLREQQRKLDKLFIAYDDENEMLRKKLAKYEGEDPNYISLVLRVPNEKLKDV